MEEIRQCLEYFKKVGKRSGCSALAYPIHLKSFAILDDWMFRF